MWPLVRLFKAEEINLDFHWKTENLENFFPPSLVSFLDKKDLLSLLPAGQTAGHRIKNEVVLC